MGSMPLRSPLPAAPFGQLVFKDALSLPRTVADEQAHFDAALDWLIRAHDATADGGVSYGYSLRGGWRRSYIETTGYIAVTFFRLARLRDDPSLKRRAEQMVDWLIRVQNEDGSFSNPRYRQTGIVFDTGQDLFGLVRAYRETKNERALAAAERAADWLVREAADVTGRFTRHTHLGVPHVYNTRVAWALLQVHQESPHEDRLRVARANLDWALTQQTAAGLYAQNAFEPGVAPFTHTVAYAIRGLWESGELLDDDRYRDSARRAANAMLAHVREDGFIPGQVDDDHRAAASYCCLTGNAQLAIVWAKMFKRDGDPRHKDAAVRALRYVMAHQDLTTSDPNRRGAIKGSHPAWGRYSPLTYPNWATKFFVDAMLECHEWLGERAQILNASFDRVTLDQTLDRAIAFVREGKRGWLCTVNVAILMMMREDPFLQRFVDRAAFIVADGQPLVWVSPWFGAKLPERVAGVDLVIELSRKAAAEGLGVYLLGAKRDVVEQVAASLREQIPGVVISGVDDGYFGDDAAEARAKAVRDSGAKILFVAMGVPRQERFLDEQWDALGVSLAIGVGGSFDVLAGLRARAPDVVQKVGMEWAFRLAQEPRRLAKRYLVTNSQFIYHVGRALVSRGARTRRNGV